MMGDAILHVIGACLCGGGAFLSGISHLSQKQNEVRGCRYSQFILVKTNCITNIHSMSLQTYSKKMFKICKSLKSDE